jgi:hypothetical protein
VSEGHGWRPLLGRDVSPAEALRMENKVGAIAHHDGLPFTSDRALANRLDVHRVLQLVPLQATFAPLRSPFSKAFLFSTGTRARPGGDT